MGCCVEWAPCDTIRTIKRGKVASRQGAAICMAFLSFVAFGSFAAVAGEDPSAACAVADPLVAGWEDVPAASRPWCYWWWVNSHVDRPTITADLEAMKRLGFGGALMFDSRGYWDDERHVVNPKPKMEVMSPEWQDCLVFALEEAARLGLSFAMNMSTSGGKMNGPWPVGADAPKRLVYRYYPSGTPASTFERPRLRRGERHRLRRRLVRALDGRRARGVSRGRERGRDPLREQLAQPADRRVWPRRGGADHEEQRALLGVSARGRSEAAVVARADPLFRLLPERSAPAVGSSRPRAHPAQGVSWRREVEAREKVEVGGRGGVWWLTFLSPPPPCPSTFFTRLHLNFPLSCGVRKKASLFSSSGICRDVETAVFCYTTRTGVHDV